MGGNERHSPKAANRLIDPAPGKKPPANLARRCAGALAINAGLLLWFAAAAHADTIKICDYAARVNARNPVIRSIVLPAGEFSVEGRVASEEELFAATSNERLAREAAGEVAEICARAAWNSQVEPGSCHDPIRVEAGEGRVLAWPFANFKLAATGALCDEARRLWGFAAEDTLRNVTVYLYQTSGRDRSTSCNFGTGQRQSRYFEIDSHFAVSCPSGIILTEIRDRWTRWFDMTVRELEAHVRAYCRDNFGFENVVIERTERDARNGRRRANYSCWKNP